MIKRFISVCMVLFLFFAINLYADQVYSTTTIDNKITIWDFEKDDLKTVDFIYERPITRFTITKNGCTLFYATGSFGTEKCDIVGYNLKKDQILWRIELDPFGIMRISSMNIHYPNKELWLLGQSFDDSQSFIIIIDLKKISIKKILSDTLMFQYMVFSVNHKKAYISTMHNFENNSSWGSVEVYSTEDYSFLKSIDFGNPGSFMGKLLKGKRGNLIVINRGKAELSLVDTKKDEIIFSQECCDNGWGMVIDRSRNCLYLTNLVDDKVSIHDLETLKYISEFALPNNCIDWSYPAMIQIDKKNKHLVHAWTDMDTYDKKIKIIDLDNYQVVNELFVGTGFFRNQIHVRK